MPKVSVNIPVYNGREYIRDTLISVLGQSFTDLEVIIIDDGSTDGTYEVIQGFNDLRIKYFPQKNKGIGAARNVALALSHGEYIAFLDQDDLWLPDKLGKQVALMDGNPSLGLVFSDTIYFDEKGGSFRYFSKKKPGRGMVFRALLKDYFLPLETVIVRKTALDEVGQFPEYMMAEEYDLFLRIACKFPVDYIDEVLAKYRVHSHNYSWGKELVEISEVRETLNRLNSTIPDFKSRYAKELASKYSGLNLTEAVVYWKQGKQAEAKRSIFRCIHDSFSLKNILAASLIYLFKFSAVKKICAFLPLKKANPFLFGQDGDG